METRHLWSAATNHRQLPYLLNYLHHFHADAEGYQVSLHQNAFLTVNGIHQVHFVEFLPRQIY